MKILDYVGMAPEPVEKPLRYVMYVRKSSEDAEAQAKSLPDQIAACKEYARTKGLLVVGEPIQEPKSAKKSGNRPLFLQMLKDIEKGKYDGILPWHPDRLSRNSLEAGKIVDPSKLKLTAEKFLNPLNSLDLQMRAADMLQMDLLARKIFLNLEIDQQKTILYRYKEPFQTLISGPNCGQISFGDPGGTRTHDTKLKRLVL